MTTNGKLGPYLSKAYPQNRVKKALPISPMVSSNETINALIYRGSLLISRESIATLCTYEEIMKIVLIIFASWVCGSSINLNMNDPAPLIIQQAGIKIYGGIRSAILPAIGVTQRVMTKAYVIISLYSSFASWKVSNTPPSTKLVTHISK